MTKVASQFSGKRMCLVAQLCLTLGDPMDCSPPGFLRQEYWSGLPFSSPGDLPNPGIKPRSLAFQADFLLAEPPGKPRKRMDYLIIWC